MRTLEMPGFSILFLALLFSTTDLFAQQTYSINGTVKGEDGKPLANVSVFLSHSGRGTITNSEGAFSMKMKTGEDELTASHIGYKSFSQKVTSGTGKLQIQLKPSPYQLAEVVVSNLTAKEMLLSAIRKIPDNYEQTPFLTKMYHRAKVLENDTIKFMEETAFDIVKSYQKEFEDEYFLVKNRQVRFDTIHARLHGLGQVDMVKGISKFVDNAFLRNH